MLEAGAQTLLIRGDALTPELRDGLVRRIASNAERLDDLLSSLLDLDRLTRGVTEADRRPTDLRALVQQVVGRVAPARPVRCVVPAIEVEVDGAQVERIVENLVVNAVLTPRTTHPSTSASPSKTITWCSGSTIAAGAWRTS